MIKFENVTFEYKQYHEGEETVFALNQINLEIQKGEFVAILGHNGSGKSTLAKHINALLIPTVGTVSVNNLETTEEENVWQIRQMAGMVFQNPDNQLVATLVDEDVAFGPENQGVEPNEIRERVDWALDVVGMKSYKNHAPHLLSGGQKQRVAIAGVLAMKPECIVFDEPTAMLDPSGREEVMNCIKKLNREEEKTIVLITHFMDEAVEADRVVVMEKGKVVLDGTPKEVFSQVKLLREYGLDVPQVTELALHLKEEGIDVATDVLNIEEMVDELCKFL